MKRLLIPLFFMLLAALACDQPTYDLPRILGVQADAETAGRVYAEVGNSEAKFTVLSEDYGRTWRPIQQAVETSYTDGYSMRGDTLYVNGSPFWSFPRPTFRFFFLNDEDRQHFALPLWNGVSASEAHGVLYVGMGTEGVLTFISPDEWHLSAVGIAQLDPLPLTISDPPTLAVIIALALLVPPLGLLHAYLLTRVWLYVLPAAKAWRAALIVTLIIILLAALAVVIWLTDARTDYYAIVAVMTGITVILSVAAALITIPQDQARRLAWRTALVALIVPAGVASIWWGWLLIIPLLAVYAIYRSAYARILREVDQATPQAVDGLALRSLGLVTLSVPAAWVLWLLMSRLVAGVEILVLTFLAVAIFSIIFIIDYMSKQALDGEFVSQSFRRTISVATILCYVLAPVLAVAVFMGQGYAHSWFTGLLVPR